MSSSAERPLSFACGGQTLIGIVHEPAAPATVAVVIVVGGPQYRAGSHRHFVLLARALATQGFAVLRFDHRGIGDSGGAQRSFEQLDADIGAAIDALLRHAPSVHQVVLFGLCDGASAALLYLHASADARVHGLCLVNPWVRSASSLARTHFKHYYLQRLMQPEFWLKLWAGKVGAQALASLAGDLGRARGSGTDGAQFQRSMAAGLAAFQHPVLLLLSEDDYTAKEFVEFTRRDRDWQAALARPRLERQWVAHADHTFSDSSTRAQVDAIIARWLRNEIAAPLQRRADTPLEGHLAC